KLKNLKINYGKNFLLEAGLELIGLPNVEETFIFGDIANLRIGKNDLQDFISDLNRKPVILPEELDRLGIIQYKGKATGFFSDLVIYGNLSTQAGNIAADLKLQFSNKLNDLSYNGTVKSNNIRLGYLTGEKDLGKFAFNINTKGSKKGDSSVQGVVKASVSELEYHGYAYKDINFDGAYDGNGFDGKIAFEDKNLTARFNGIIDLSRKLPFFDFALTVDHIDLYALKLIESFPNSSLSFKAATNMTGNSFDNINGFLRFDSLEFSNQGKTLNVDSILLRSDITDDNTNVSITSDYLNGSFKGNFRYSAIGNTINNLLEKYLPAIVRNSSNSAAVKNTNRIDINLQLKNSGDISEALNLPYRLEGTSSIQGKIDEAANHVHITANFPLIRLEKQQMENLAIQLSNVNRTHIELTCRTQYTAKKELTNFFLNASASKDMLNMRLGWQNTKDITYAGNIDTETKFLRENGSFSANMNIKPTEIILADSTWRIHPGNISWNAGKSIQVNNFKIDNHSQFIHINGKASKDENDRLDVAMNKLSLDFILELAGLKGFKIGGVATGGVSLFNLFSHPVYEADIHVDDVKLNSKRIGNADLFSTWDKENEYVRAKGTFYDSDRVVIEADGIYAPKNDSLDFVFDTHDVSIEFLSKYFDGVVGNLQGLASGKIRMFGPSKTMGFEGAPFVRNGQATVLALKTTYTFNDYVYLNRNLLEVKNLHLFDSDKNRATANGRIIHDGLFADMDYNFHIASKNIMAINTQSNDNEYFFGKAYVDGSVRIYGDMNETNITVNAVSKPRSKVYIRMAGMSTASDNSFIKFVEKDVNPYVTKVEKDKNGKKQGVNVKINLQIEATPEAEIELITDPKAGDMINARGSGSLRVEFDTYSDVKLFGTYTIESGYYLFSLQNLIRKNFRIERGSSISWSGDLKNANINLRAIYSLSASLLDLMDRAQLQFVTNRSSIPVNCVLILTDNLMNPTIAFNIDLPSSDESVKQLIRSIISTEEMMNRQILFLLLLGRFYTPDYLATTDAGANSGNEGLAFATATLSGWMSKVFQNSKISLGFDMRSDEQTSQYQTEIHYQPNDRLIVNGNLGYRQDELVEDKNRFISDLDMEYLLTESGKLRFKGYRHTIDRLRAAQVSYGAGVLYKEEFKSIKDMFNYYWQAFNRIWKKEEKAEKQE
ncbi:MAG: translocation/assembly module TamB, partial [Prevotellaceae bacterium]|nr:translocation/assembly module TamB [Prevotellaceae bacterium]